MKVNVIYEDSGIVDLIDVPPHIIPQLENLQENFFNWMFDRTIEHEYWVYQNGKKASCCYDAKAFIKWVNINYPSNVSKIHFLKSNVELDKNNFTIYF